MIFHFIFMPRRFPIHPWRLRVARAFMFCRRCLIWANWRWIGNLKVLGTRKNSQLIWKSTTCRVCAVRLSPDGYLLPDDFRTELNSRFGSAFSLEPSLLQSAYFRVHNRDRKIRGLYFVGAGTHPGAGIPGVVNSAKATASLILHDMKSLMAREGGLLPMSPMREGMSPEVKAALEQCRWMIRKGSKSFSLAAKLFDSDTRDAAFFLYGWCRYCDDQVDDAGKTESQDELAKRVKALKENTNSAFSFAQQREPRVCRTAVHCSPLRNSQCTMPWS